MLTLNLTVLDEDLNDNIMYVEGRLWVLNFLNKEKSS